MGGTSTNEQVERIVLRQLIREWSSANWAYLNEQLRPPVLRLADFTAKYGTWSSASRTLSIQRELALNAPWEQVVEVLRHEMAHQYADEILDARGERPHGTAFRHACRLLAIDPVVAGLAEVGEEPAVSRRVRKLLALANSPNRHEAELAMTKARRLMLEHEVGASESQFTSRIVGARKMRHSRWEKTLAGMLGRHFFVHVIWIRSFDRDRGRVVRCLEVTGAPHNVAFAAYVHAFLQRTAESLWQQDKKRRRKASNKYRQHFHDGVMRGFDLKLTEQSQRCAEEGLVWIGSGALTAHYQGRHPRIVSRRGGAARFSHARGRGLSAGRQIVLHRPIAANGAPGVRALLESS